MVITNIKYEQVFGNLTVLGLSLVRRSGPKQKPIYVCKCQCNKTVEVSEYDLISGHVKSCDVSIKNMMNRKKVVCMKYGRI